MNFDESLFNKDGEVIPDCNALSQLLHEIGHHETALCAENIFMCEYLASAWAFTKMQNNGIKIPQWLRDVAADYTLSYLENPESIKLKWYYFGEEEIEKYRKYDSIYDEDYFDLDAYKWLIENVPEDELKDILKENPYETKKMVKTTETEKLAS